MNYDTMSKRRRLSYDILNGFQERDTVNQNLGNQAAMICKNYLLPDSGEDAKLRDQAVLCAQVISGAADELMMLDGRYHLSDSKATRWITITNMDVTSYLPPVDIKLEDSNGNKISEYAKEFNLIMLLLNRYDHWSNHPRSEWLKYNNIYDDTYIRQRVIQGQKKIYGSVISDVSQNKWKNISTSSKTVMTDMETYEWETSIYPNLPKPEDFDNLLVRDGKPGGLTKYLDTLSAINTIKVNGKRLDFFDQLKLSFKDISTYALMYLNDKNLTMEYAIDVLDKMPEYLYYEVQGVNYFLVRVEDKKIIKIDPLTKQEFVEPYYDTNDMVRYYVYDDEELKPLYNNYKYKAQIQIEFISGYVSPELADKEVEPTCNVTDEALQGVCSECREKMLKIIDDANWYYSRLDPLIRCEDFKPAAHYDSFYQTLAQLNPINVQQCNLIIDYCKKEIYPWINKRMIVLKNSTSDRDNAEIMIQLLKKRLTKGSGTFLNWYQTAIQFDGTYLNSSMSNPINDKLIKKGLVCKAYNDSDPNLFNKQLCPNYIDIEEKDYSYGFNDKFKVGDKIYIINDISEQENIIDNITSVEISKYNDNANMDDVNKKGFADTLTVKVKVTRLMLKRPIPKWCNVDNVSDIRVLKLL